MEGSDDRGPCEACLVLRKLKQHRTEEASGKSEAICTALSCAQKIEAAPAEEVSGMSELICTGLKLMSNGGGGGGSIRSLDPAYELRQQGSG